MSKILQFSSDHYDQYPINYNPETHAVDFPKVPQDIFAAVCILDRIMRDVIDAGTLTIDDVDMVFLNATGQLKPRILKGEEKC